MPVTVELDEPEELAAQLWADARRALRKARRAGAGYVVGGRLLPAWQLRLERVGEGVWLSSTAEADEHVAHLEQVLAWRRAVLAALGRQTTADSRLS